MIRVPAAFARSTVEREGTAGRAWIEALPSLVEDLCRRWSLVVSGDPYHGYAGIVVPVTRRDEMLVLKVSWMDRSNEQEALVLRALRGRGAVRLFESRPEDGALLLERLHPERSLEDEDHDVAVVTAGRLLRRLAIPAPEGLRRVASETSVLLRDAEARWEQHGRPFPRDVLDLSFDVGRASTTTSPNRLVNQDLHYANVLAGDREPWLVIDPKAVSGPLEFGVAQLLWNRFDELERPLDLDRRLDLIVRSAGLEAVPARRWSVLRLTELWLWALDLRLSGDPRRCRILIEWLMRGV